MNLTKEEENRFNNLKYDDCYITITKDIDLEKISKEIVPCIYCQETGILGGETCEWCDGEGKNCWKILMGILARLPASWITKSQEEVDKWFNEDLLKLRKLVDKEIE